jgi:hypothetical protein
MIFVGHRRKFCGPSFVRKMWDICGAPEGPQNEYWSWMRGQQVVCFFTKSQCPPRPVGTRRLGGFSRCHIVPARREEPMCDIGIPLTVIFCPWARWDMGLAHWKSSLSSSLSSAPAGDGRFVRYYGLVEYLPSPRNPKTAQKPPDVSKDRILLRFCTLFIISPLTSIGLLAPKGAPISLCLLSLLGSCGKSVEHRRAHKMNIGDG